MASFRAFVSPQDRFKLSLVRFIYSFFYILSLFSSSLTFLINRFKLCLVCFIYFFFKGFFQFIWISINRGSHLLTWFSLAQSHLVIIFILQDRFRYFAHDCKRGLTRWKYKWNGACRWNLPFAESSQILNDFLNLFSWQLFTNRLLKKLNISYFKQLEKCDVNFHI